MDYRTHSETNTNQEIDRLRGILKAHQEKLLEVQQELKKTEENKWKVYERCHQTTKTIESRCEYVEEKLDSHKRYFFQAMMGMMVVWGLSLLCLFLTPGGLVDLYIKATR